MRRRKVGAILIGFVAAGFFLASFYESASTPFASIGAKQFPSLYQQDEGVVVYYKVYDDQESKATLGRDLLQKGFQPVQISIENSTTRTYALSTAGVSCPLATPHDVAWKYSKDSIPRSIAYKVLSFFYFPFMIPGTIDSILTFSKHMSFKTELTAKCIKEEEELILPFSTLNRVIFIPEDQYEPRFTVTLTDINSGKQESFSS